MLASTRFHVNDSCERERQPNMITSVPCLCQSLLLRQREGGLRIGLQDKQEQRKQHEELASHFPSFGSKMARSSRAHFSRKEIMLGPWLWLLARQTFLMPLSDNNESQFATSHPDTHLLTDYHQNNKVHVFVFPTHSPAR